ncbi:flagellar protein FlaG [Caldicoprobacter algeriensis]|uniref:flagellar protein FlaG n=1 Tax=Caldicoprobacter algeriensis TaxID=699281 RepID=UPI00207AC265|nr:flagellar protein FlaG [Caldicoprobacter algeriensis]MCM8900487.1 flagellar protein FlaG [Caldicoprobacter algeriensis]
MEGRIQMRVESVSTITTVKPAPKVQPESKNIGFKESGDLNRQKVDSSLNGNVSQDDIMQAVKRANKALEGTNRRFEYSIHDQTNTIMIKVIDTETNEVIREIPPEKILNLIAKLWELAGIIVDERV